MDITNRIAAINLAQTDDLLPYMDITNQTAAINLAENRQTGRHENQTSRVSQNYDLSQNQKAKAKEVRVCFRI